MGSDLVFSATILMVAASHGCNESVFAAERDERDKYVILQTNPTKFSHYARDLQI